MKPMIAVCGLTCTECEAYLATQAHDEAAKERIAAQWSQMFNAPGLTAAYVTCDGCLAFDGHLGGHCLECEIRTCGVSRGYANCAHCPEFGDCAKLAGFLAQVPAARATLEGIRSTLAL